MKYFTPELLARFASKDERTASAASATWERAQQKYLKHLRAIKTKLPAKFRSLLERFYLHDASVLSIVGEKSLYVFLEPDEAEPESLLLIYKLAKDPVILHHPILEEPGTPLQWQYDEITIEKQAPSPIFRHDILFTSGRELKIRFHGFDWKTGKKILAPTAEPLVSHAG